MKITHLIPFLLLATISHAQEVAKLIQITCDYVQMDSAMASEILIGGKAPKTGTECRSTLINLLADKSVQSLGSVTVTTKSGQRATSESAQEMIYATEFDPAQGRAENAPALPTNQSGVDVPTPTSFEIKPVGLRMEAEPTLSLDGKTADLNLAPELCRYFGEAPGMKLKQADGSDQEVITHPKTYVMKVQTATTVSDGASSIIGCLLPPDADGNADATKRVLIFISLKIVTP
jgi:Flp pilus assembly secretin CpaC